MSQRNAMNERYLDGGPDGQTRKSAASAKPKRKAAETVYVREQAKTPAEKRKEEKAKRQEAQKRIAKAGQPDTPQYKVYRKYWWICLGAGIACVTASWILRELLPSNIIASYVFLGLSYVGIIAAFVVDWKYIRPIRNAHRAAASKPLSKNQQRKQEKEESEKAAAQAAKKAARKEQGLGRFLPGGSKKKANEVGALIEEEKATTNQSAAASGQDSIIEKTR